MADNTNSLKLHPKTLGKNGLSIQEAGELVQIQCDLAAERIQHLDTKKKLSTITKKLNEETTKVKELEKITDQLERENKFQECVFDKRLKTVQEKNSKLLENQLKIGFKDELRKLKSKHFDEVETIRTEHEHQRNLNDQITKKLIEKKLLECETKHLAEVEYLTKLATKLQIDLNEQMKCYNKMAVQLQIGEREKKFDQGDILKNQVIDELSRLKTEYRLKIQELEKQYEEHMKDTEWRYKEILAERKKDFKRQKEVSDTIIKELSSENASLTKEIEDLHIRYGMTLKDLESARKKELAAWEADLGLCAHKRDMYRQQLEESIQYSNALASQFKAELEKRESSLINKNKDLKVLQEEMRDVILNQKLNNHLVGDSKRYPRKQTNILIRTRSSHPYADKVE